MAIIEQNVLAANNSAQVQDVFNDTVNEKLNVVFSWLFPESYPKELDLSVLEEIQAHVTQNTPFSSHPMESLYEKNRNYDGNRFQCGWLRNTFSKNIYIPEYLDIASKALGDMMMSVRSINQTVTKGYDNYIIDMIVNVNSAIENYLNDTITKKALATTISQEDLNNKFLELVTHFSQLETYIDELTQHTDEFIFNRQIDYEEALYWDEYPSETLRGSDNFPVLKTLNDWFVNKGGKAKLEQTKAFSPQGGNDINSTDETNIWQFLQEAFTGVQDFTKDLQKNISSGLVEYKKVLLSFLQEMENYLQLATMDTDVYM